jgi:(methylthio)acryloyl-CoA hydratase
VSGPIDRSHAKPSHLEQEGQPRSGLLLPSTLTVSQRGSIMQLRLSRSAKRNALHEGTIAGLETFSSDPLEERRIVVLDGEGKHFSAGASLCSFTDISAWDRSLVSPTWHRAFDHIEIGDAPVIAVLHGAVIVGGPEIAAAERGGR